MNIVYEVPIRCPPKCSMKNRGGQTIGIVQEGDRQERRFEPVAVSCRASASRSLKAASSVETVNGIRLGCQGHFTSIGEQGWGTAGVEKKDFVLRFETG